MRELECLAPHGAALKIARAASHLLNVNTLPVHVTVSPSHKAKLGFRKKISVGIEAFVVSRR